jgi:hypothetical protein
MLSGSHVAIRSEPFSRIDYADIIGGDDHRRRTARARALPDPLNQGPVADDQERFSRKARSREARRYDYVEHEVKFSPARDRMPFTVRAGRVSAETCSSLTFKQGIIGAQNTSFVRQHHRNALAHGIGQPIRPAHELERIAGTGAAQRSFANRTYQQVEQTLIHNTLKRARRALR